jgi:chromosome segregation protein
VKNPTPDSLIDPLCVPGSPEAVRTDPRVIAPAERLVSCTNPEAADLPRQLIGRTFLVTDVNAARALAAQAPNYRFLTLRGDLLDADGRLTVGTHHAEAGLLSRKCELSELRDQAAQLNSQADSLDSELAQLREQIAGADARAETQQREIEVLAEQSADLRSRLGQHRQRRDGLDQEVTLSRTETSNLENDLLALQSYWTEARAKADAAEQRVRHLEAHLQETDQAIHRIEAELQRVQQHGTAASVARAQAEERLTAVRAKHSQVQTDLQLRAKELAQTEARLDDLRTRLQQGQLTALQTSGELAMDYVEKESAERALITAEAERCQLRACREQLAEQTKVGRAAWRQQQQEAHDRELTAGDLRGRRVQLTERLREDYQVELAELYERSGKGLLPASEPPALDAVQANEEIAELRRKLARLGSVNLEALRELAELEERAKTLQAQFDDLNNAQRALEDIINKINGDSRKLFSETFTAIRGHFQELFRKLFGGGMADILMEDESDILESGIDIIARPPGKELRNLSLMSGGEKTMTAVALLLAIFRSKPSPFCILDEVDAALDESNIGRFTAVLREFLDRSQFILITHSKRTMSAADVLYGVTMQESGVSKRVAVRFEDWPEGGSADAETPAPLRRAA